VLIGTGGAGGRLGASRDRQGGGAFRDVIETEWVADVGQLSGVQLLFPLSCGNGGETRCADGVVAAIWITPVGKAWS
jgi:hypothetical protein